MDKKIKTILDDLYQLDPQLKNHEKELIKIVEKLLAARPDTKFDKRFAKKLRAQLLGQAKETRSASSLKNNFMFMNKFAYISIGVIVAAIVIVPTILFINQPSQTGTPVATLGINHLASNAFGLLTAQTDQAAEAALGIGAGAAPVASNIVAADAVVKTNEAVDSFAVRTQGGGGGAGVATSMVMPAPLQFKYVYQGDPITIDQASMPVYRRTKDSSLGASLSRLVGNVGLGLVNSNSFGNLGVQSISLVQDQDFGYMLNVDFNEGMVSIYQNWQRWEQPAVYQPLSPGQLPDDSSLLKLANDFVLAHGINLDGYGDPIVRDDWKNYQGEITYAPDQLTVIYPLEIEGRRIYDYSGYPTGINVNVDVRNNRVAGAYNILVNKFDSSDYATEIDASRLISIAERGGQYNPVFYDSGDLLEVALGTPKLVYVQTYHYNEKTQEHSQLFVPALIFPVINRDSKLGYAPQNIIVPIVKDLIQEPQVVPPVRPLPEPLLLQTKPGVAEDTAIEQ